MSKRPKLLKASDISALPEKQTAHYLNSKAVRHTRSLGDIVGLNRIGVNLVRLEPGAESTEYHFHYYEEEFIYILSGSALAIIDGVRYRVSTGDFMGFSIEPVPHTMLNDSDEDLLYIISGERKDIDICDYPDAGKRGIYFGDSSEVVDIEK